jgi:hypothetical protein
MTISIGGVSMKVFLAAATAAPATAAALAACADKYSLVYDVA